MNTPTATPPRFTCRVVRSWSALAGDPTTGHGSGLGSSHLETCADCRRFFAAGRELEFTLKRAAVTAASGAPTGLEDRIIDAVNRSVRPPSRRSSGLPMLALGGVLSAVAFAFFLLQKPPAPVKAERMAVVQTQTFDPVDTGAEEESAASRLLISLRPLADTLVQQNPLQSEVDSVYSDARSAMRFLAMNFLPLSSETPGSGAGGGRRVGAVGG